MHLYKQHQKYIKQSTIELQGKKGKVEIDLLITKLKFKKKINKINPKKL